jgi:REP element-mobilizing transposase RayT
MKKNYTCTTNSIFNLGYHITWCPKYRKSFLLDLDQSFLKRIFQIVEIKVCGHIESIEIMLDHIHIFIFIRLKQIIVCSIITYSIHNNNYRKILEMAELM